MKARDKSPWRLSQVDAFFVAYQEASRISMLLGSEVELEGEIKMEHLVRTLVWLVGKYPPLGRTLKSEFFGLVWGGPCRVDKMLKIGENETELEAWRSQAIDPFKDPPYQILWIPGNGKNILSFRAHHAVSDGEFFLMICVEALDLLTQVASGKPVPNSEPVPQVQIKDFVSPSILWKNRSLKNMLGYLRWQSQEARLNRSVRLVVRRRKAAPVSTCMRTFGKAAFFDLKDNARKLGVPPALLCATSWMRAIHQWNCSRGEGSNSLVSLEIPLSLRQGRAKHGSLGNFVSPLILFADARQSLEDLARSLKAQFNDGIEKKLHFSIPFLTSPAKWLPWSLYRRIAVNTTSTGFATSHFTWMKHKEDVRQIVSENSNHTFRLMPQRILTPVCLNMGAALSVLAWPDQAQFFLNYRVTAFSKAEAEKLFDLVMSELQGSLCEKSHVGV